ncbi:MAG: threonine synthase [Sphingobacteriales bacterium]|nr:threonine synthase [Sphingobacteriales bacterium]
MFFYSTRHQSPNANLRQAVMQGLPTDNGLYMPSHIEKLPASFFDQIENLSFPEISFAVAQCLLQDTIPAADLKEIVYKAINFDAPLIPINQNLACLELTHGPSLAFKDFGARFMAQIMQYFVRQSKQKLYILVATSGDTGGAVAQGFLGVEGIEVIILYPSKKISELQEKQLTTLGNNITALEVAGTFDDCQHLVKQAFLDTQLQQHLQLSSANSINLARLVPQAFYYVYAYAQAKKYGKPVVFSVPSGNFGNLTAGLLAKRIGTPIHHFVAANNANNVFTQYHHTALFNPRSSVTTLSNAMDVGNPSNLQRIQDLYNNDIDAIRADIDAYDYTDQQTVEAMKQVYEKYNYLMCPHTAVAYLGINSYLANHPTEDITGVFLATAHPAKFLDIVEPALNIKVPLPENLAKLVDRPKQAIPMSTQFADFKAYLMQL